MLRPAKQPYCACPYNLADESLGVREYLRSYSTATRDRVNLFNRPRHPLKPKGMHLPPWAFRLAKEAQINHSRYINSLCDDPCDIVVQRVAQTGTSSRLYQIVHSIMFVCELMTTMIGEIPRAEETRVFPPGFSFPYPEEDEDEDDNKDQNKNKKPERHPWWDFPELEQACIRTIRMMAQVILDERYAYSLFAVYTMAAACVITQIKVSFEWVARQRREEEWLATYDALRLWKKARGPRPHAHVTDTEQLYTHGHEWDMSSVVRVFDHVASKIHGTEWTTSMRGNISVTQLVNAERWVVLLYGNDVVLDVCDPVMSHLCQHISCPRSIDGCFESDCTECDTLRRVYHECIKMFATLDCTKFVVTDTLLTTPERDAVDVDMTVSVLPPCQVVAYEIGAAVCHFMDPKHHEISTRLYSKELQDRLFYAIYFAITPTNELAERLVSLIERDRMAKHNQTT